MMFSEMGMRQSAFEDREGTSCPCLAEVSALGGLLPNKFQEKENIGSLPGGKSRSSVT